MKDLENDNEIVSEDLDDSVVEEEYSADKVKKLREKIKEAEAKAKEYLDGWQRSQADFANLRRRDEEAKVEYLKFAEQGLILQLMPVIDSLELSLAHPSSSGQVATGLEVIYKQFLSVLKANGLEEDNPKGEQFDPRKHESIGVVVVERPEDDHKIVEIVQKGYILSGKIIRPAKVKIGEFNS